MDNIKHAIITRIKFEEQDMLEHFLEIAKKTFIPSLVSQTRKNFSLFVIGLPQNKDYICNVLANEGIDVAHYCRLGEMKTYILEKKFDIQTRLDCDDWIHSTAIEKIQKLYSDNIHKHEEFLICSRPMRISYENFIDNKNAPNIKMNAFPSNFLSVCKNQNDKYWVYSTAHAEYISIIPNLFYLGDDMSKWIIHGKNLSLLKRKNDV